MRALTVGAAIAVVGLAALPASAHDKAFKSRVTIEAVDQPNYRGQVFSGSPSCVRHRRVQFWYDGEGAEPDQLVATVKADEHGRWQFGFVGKAYYAKVKRVVKTPGNHHHVCKPDRSPTVTPPPPRSGSAG